MPDTSMALVIIRVNLNGTFSGNFSRFMLACITAQQACLSTFSHHACQSERRLLKKFLAADARQNQHDHHVMVQGMRLHVTQILEE